LHSIEVLYKNTDKEATSLHLLRSTTVQLQTSFTQIEPD